MRPVHQYSHIFLAELAELAPAGTSSASSPAVGCRQSSNFRQLDLFCARQRRQLASAVSCASQVKKVTLRYENEHLNTRLLTTTHVRRRGLLLYNRGRERWGSSRSTTTCSPTFSLSSTRPRSGTSPRPRAPHTRTRMRCRSSSPRSPCARPCSSPNSTASRLPTTRGRHPQPHVERRRGDRPHAARGRARALREPRGARAAAHAERMFVSDARLLAALGRWACERMVALDSVGAGRGDGTAYAVGGRQPGGRVRRDGGVLHDAVNA